MSLERDAARSGVGRGGRYCDAPSTAPVRLGDPQHVHTLLSREWERTRDLYGANESPHDLRLDDVVAVVDVLVVLRLEVGEDAAAGMGRHKLEREQGRGGENGKRLHGGLVVRWSWRAC